MSGRSGADAGHPGPRRARCRKMHKDGAWEFVGPADLGPGRPQGADRRASPHHWRPSSSGPPATGRGRRPTKGARSRGEYAGIQGEHPAWTGRTHLGGHDGHLGRGSGELSLDHGDGYGAGRARDRLCRVSGSPARFQPGRVRHQKHLSSTCIGCGLNERGKRTAGGRPDGSHSKDTLTGARAPQGGQPRITGGKRPASPGRAAGKGRTRTAQLRGDRGGRLGWSCRPGPALPTWRAPAWVRGWVRMLFYPKMQHSKIVLWTQNIFF